MISRGLDYYIEKTDSCWNWKGGLNTKGYGEYWDGQRMVRAHRFVFEKFKEKIPKDLQLDHLCRNPSCVNPEHLEIVTNKENIRRGENHVAKKMAQTNCIKGHKLNGLNLYITPSGHRRCKICQRDRYNKFMEGKK